MKRLKRVRALFGFLRQQRHVLFDDAFQDALAEMYRETGAGDEPLPPAMLCMALLLQGYVGVSDAEAVECSVVDLRWQMVLGCLRHDGARVLPGGIAGLPRAVDRARDGPSATRTDGRVGARAGTFTDAEKKALSKAIRIAVDSRPFYRGPGELKTRSTFSVTPREASCESCRSSPGAKRRRDLPQGRGPPAARVQHQGGAGHRLERRQAEGHRDRDRRAASLLAPSMGGGKFGCMGPWSR